MQTHSLVDDAIKVWNVLNILDIKVILAIRDSIDRFTELGLNIGVLAKFVCNERKSGGCGVTTGNNEESRISIKFWGDVWAVRVEKPTEDIVFLGCDLYWRQLTFE